MWENKNYTIIQLLDASNWVGVLSGGKELDIMAFALVSWMDSVEGECRTIYSVYFDSEKRVPQFVELRSDFDSIKFIDRTDIVANDVPTQTI